MKWNIVATALFVALSSPSFASETLPANLNPVENCQNGTLNMGEFDVTASYNYCDKVTFKHNNSYTFEYIAQDTINAGETPLNSNKWVAVIPYGLGFNWVPGHQYFEGDLVTYAGRYWNVIEYTNSEPTLNNSAYRVVGQLQEWQEGFEYRAGESVLMNGVKYTAKWWTQDKPDMNDQWGAWEAIITE